MVTWIAALAVLASVGAASAADCALTLDRLVRGSDRIVTGTLTVSHAEKLSVMLNEAADGPADIVVTYVDIAPTAYITGRSDDRPTLRLLGGRWGDWAIVDVDGPMIEDGEEALLFMAESETPRRDQGVAYYLPEGRLGKLDIAWRKGERVVVPPSETGNLGLTPNGVDVGEGWIDLDTVRQMIGEAVASQAAAAAAPASK